MLGAYGFYLGDPGYSVDHSATAHRGSAEHVQLVCYLPLLVCACVPEGPYLPVQRRIQRKDSPAWDRIQSKKGILQKARPELQQNPYGNNAGTKGCSRLCQAHRYEK